MLTQQYANIPDVVYNMRWYQYPRKYQNYVLMIMMRSQRPYYINGFGIMRCTLETFVNVSLMGWSTGFVLLVFLALFVYPSYDICDYL